MSVSIFDSRIFKNTFGAQEVRDVFSDENYVKCLIEAEAALARAEAKTGVISAEVGASLTSSLARVQIEYSSRHKYHIELLTRPVLIAYRKKRMLLDTLSCH